jgi:ParB family chromosome partitioning protein
LAQSIQSAGLMQPVIVRPIVDHADGPIRFELVAGERRWRAAQIVGLDNLPAIVRPLDDRQIAEWAIIENLQREDLNPIDRAEAFQRLATQFNLSHDEIAGRVGLDRSSITNSLRLLGLCDDVRALVREGLVSAGQAKVLAGIANPKQQAHLANRAVKQEWSVRQLEQTARLLAGNQGAGIETGPAPKTPALSAHLADLEQQIGQQLGTKAKIRPGRKKGTGSLTIEFHSIDQFDSLLAKLGVETN